MRILLSFFLIHLQIDYQTRKKNCHDLTSYYNYQIVKISDYKSQKSQSSSPILEEQGKNIQLICFDRKDSKSDMVCQTLFRKKLKQIIENIFSSYPVYTIL